MSAGDSSPFSPTSSPKAIDIEESSVETKSDLGVGEAAIQLEIDQEENVEGISSGEAEEESNGSGRNRCIMLNTLTTRVLDCLLRQRVMSDTITHPILVLLATNAKYVALALLGVYVAVFIFIWMPLYLLARIVTEFGVYALLLSTGIYAGRCLLRLLAFPGTNVRVYGEVENEFTKYSCRMLDAASSALIDFCLSLSSNSNGVQSKSGQLLGNEEGWSIVDVPATYKRVLIFRDRVLGTYLEVLTCILEENGRGMPTDVPTAAGSRNGFYDMTANACKVTCSRNLCCDRGGGSNGNILNRSTSDVESAYLSSAGVDTSRTVTLSELTKFGNNPLMGDIGNAANTSVQAKSDGRELLALLTSLLGDLAAVEDLAGEILNNTRKAELKNVTITPEINERIQVLTKRAEELRDFTSRIKSLSSPDGSEDEGQDDESDVGAESVRHRLEEQETSASTSTVGMVRSAVQAFLSMIDPPPHKSVFGLDAIRGTFLARYRGAKQFFVDRGWSDGRLDCIMIPSTTRDEGKRRAVLYCNPNAGLIEVATGMGLTGGNVAQDDDSDDSEDGKRTPSCWTEFYIQNGYDVYLFNYAGYGRSFGGSDWNDNFSREFSHGVFACVKRVFFSIFFAFKPSSESLKTDSAMVAKFLVDVVGVEELVLHGESIGGLSAAGAARALTPASAAKACPVSLLICDRTFCNLESVAQRLVGQWTGNAIRLLAPTWSTDVARDYLWSRCPKIIANDCSDEIIHDFSSLKSGVSLSSELKCATRNAGWAMPAPLEYRMADLDAVGVAKCRISRSFSQQRKPPPTWPADKNVTLSEAFHFAACVKRIGKVATKAKTQINAMMLDIEEDGEEEGVEVSYAPDDASNHSSVPKSSVEAAKFLAKIWSTLALTDGLCGHTLGHTVKEGFDCTVAWLCTVLTLGGQVLAEQAEKRWSSGVEDCDRILSPDDFDMRPTGHTSGESELARHPLPIPEVLSTLKDIMNKEAHFAEDVEAELAYIVGVLEYILARLTSREVAAVSMIRRTQIDNRSVAAGCFLNLHCGHNNQYSEEEQEKLVELIQRFSKNSSNC